MGLELADTKTLIFTNKAIFWFLVLYKLNSCFKIITLLSRDKKCFNKLTYLNKIIFLEFKVVQGATVQVNQLAPSNFNPWRASGQLLISNTE